VWCCVTYDDPSCGHTTACDSFLFQTGFAYDSLKPRGVRGISCDLVCFLFFSFSSTPSTSNLRTQALRLTEDAGSHTHRLKLSWFSHATSCQSVHSTVRPSGSVTSHCPLPCHWALLLFHQVNYADGSSAAAQSSCRSQSNFMERDIDLPTCLNALSQPERQKELSSRSRVAVHPLEIPSHINAPTR
jgi:hypothetical protein